MVFIAYELRKELYFSGAIMMNLLFCIELFFIAFPLYLPGYIDLFIVYYTMNVSL